MLPYLPLKGVRVIEFCWIWAGPFLGQFLADLGAEVIKIEWHKRFDPYRTRGVERMRKKVPGDVWIDLSTSFHSLNRNKVGLTVNLKHPEGIEIIKRLAGKSDLLIENWTGGTLDGLGLSNAVLHEANPKLVIVSLSAFGARSRLDGMRSYGLVTSALAGTEAEIKDGAEMAGSPTFVISDPNAALFGLLAGIAGLRQARDAGKGMAVTVSQLEAMMSIVAGGPKIDESDIVQGIHATRDGKHVAVTLRRSLHDLPQPLEAWCAARDAATVLSEVRAMGGYAEAMVELADTPEAEPFSDVEVRIATEHLVTGYEEIVAAPWRVNGKRPPLRKTAPRLGEGNGYVLRQILGASEEEIAAWQREGVV